MHLRRVAVLGGGPGGLYAARLLKLRDPRCEVVVHDQEEPGGTFGFGVGLSAHAQRRLAAADPDTLYDVLAAARRHDLELHASGAVARVLGELVGVARTDLLAVLRRHAERAGVRLDLGAQRAAAELDADLVVAADGAGSATRAAGPYGATVETGGSHYLWAGAGFALDAALFAAVHTEHGPFVLHAYPYAPERSTFLVETDEATMRHAGLGAGPVDGDGSDGQSLAYLSQVFAEHLRGTPLLGNRTRWTRFRTVRCARWSDGRTVLLGDAAHTAHYSVGSGTKLAMEDAIALREALATHPALPSALAAYERVRRPAVQRLQDLAGRSARWWEQFPARQDLPAERLLVAYMTRAGNVPAARLAAYSPDVVQRALAQYAGAAPEAAVPPSELTAWVVRQPLDTRRRVLPDRVLRPDTPGVVRASDRRDAPDDAVVLAALPVGAAADVLVACAAQARRAGADGVVLAGPPDRSAVLDRLELAERLRRSLGGLVAVDGPRALLDDLAAGLLAGRTDLIAITEEAA